MLELLTLKQLDPQHCVEVPQLLEQVRDRSCTKQCAMIHAQWLQNERIRHVVCAVQYVQQTTCPEFLSL
jgi:hypothetical protein